MVNDTNDFYKINEMMNDTNINSNPLIISQIGISTLNTCRAALTLITHDTKNAIIVAVAIPYNPQSGISNRFPTIFTIAPMTEEEKMAFVRFAAWKPADQNSANA